MKDDTLLVTQGRDPKSHARTVNQPVYHASTLIFESLAELDACNKNRFETVTYARHGTPTTFALQDTVAALEGGAKAQVTPSGVAAIATALTAFLRHGDHLLMVDTVYGPTRSFCDIALERIGVEVTYYDPLVGAGIGGLMRDNTKVVFSESPGSSTFEVQDIPAIAEAVHARGAVLINDNTWASPLFFKSFEHGVDVSVHGATKYILGHSDAMLGMIVTTAEAYKPLKLNAALYGQCAGPDDVYLALRGMRTLSVRLQQHQKNALIVARWLQSRAEVARVLYPALEDDPGHALWKRDFMGASGLLGVVLAKPYERPALAAMIDNLALFGIGYSWGGYESLVTLVDLAGSRTATRWEAPGPLLRLHIGLEDPGDLIADLEAGLARLSAAA